MRAPPPTAEKKRGIYVRGQTSPLGGGQCDCSVMKPDTAKKSFTRSRHPKGYCREWARNPVHHRPPLSKGNHDPFDHGAVLFIRLARRKQCSAPSGTSPLSPGFSEREGSPFHKKEPSTYLRQAESITSKSVNDLAASLRLKLDWDVSDAKVYIKHGTIDLMLTCFIS